MTSPMQSMLERLVELGPRAHAVLDGILDELPATELAAMAYDFSGTWARPAQVVPDGDWRSVGFMTGRGWGKTASVVSYTLGEMAEGRAMRVALVGQNETKTIEILVEGETGMLAMAPPWLGARWEPSSNRVTLANGAAAYVYTPQEPAGLRGPQHHLAIATEVAAWPAATRAEAMSNLLLGLRLGYGRLLWDSTPKRRNPTIRELLRRSVRHPQKHIVIRGKTSENEINLSRSVVAEWIEQYGGTQQGREELDGEYLDADENCLFKPEWIDLTRRRMPEVLHRRVISVDPAITNDPRYSDRTGIVDVGLGVDAQAYVLGDLSGKHRAEDWAGIVIDAYTRGGCDLVVLETNRGGNSHVALLRVAARERGQNLVVVGPTEVPGRIAGTVYVRSINSRGSKADRASPVAALMERGRVSFLLGAELADLEDRLATFDGSGKSGANDDAIDAMVMGIIEVTNAGRDAHDPRSAFRGLADANESMPGARTRFDDHWESLGRLPGGGGRSL